MPRRLRDLEIPAHLVEFLLGSQLLVARASLRMIWSGVCRRRLLDVMVLPFFLPSRATKSHNTWTTMRASPQPTIDRCGTAVTNCAPQAAAYDS